MRLAILAFAAIFILGSALGSAAAVTLQTFTTEPLTIDTAKGPDLFTVELALTPGQQEQGLMFRRALAPNAGMLFVFPDTRQAVFWMKNTLIPLDMLFITENGTIADLHERAVPLSEENIVSKVPVKAVLELDGGTVSRLGIKIGDTVHAAALGNAL
ncbi:MAG: DUF192 domain-containing protein [Stellaceae bacterium]